MNPQEQYEHELAHQDIQMALSTAQHEAVVASRTAPIGVPVKFTHTIDRSAVGECAAGLPVEVITIVTRLDDDTVTLSAQPVYDDGDESEPTVATATYAEAEAHFEVVKMQDMFARAMLKMEFDPDEAEADIFEADRGISF